jgi:hypothetical protein
MEHVPTPKSLIELPEMSCTHYTDDLRILSYVDRDSLRTPYVDLILTQTFCTDDNRGVAEAKNIRRGCEQSHQRSSRVG